MTAGQSVDQHFLASYYHAVLAIILAQFSKIGFEDGMTGVIRLVQSSPYIKVCALSALISFSDINKFSSAS